MFWNLILGHSLVVQTRHCSFQSVFPLKYRRLCMDLKLFFHSGWRKRNILQLEKAEYLLKVYSQLISIHPRDSVPNACVYNYKLKCFSFARSWLFWFLVFVFQENSIYANVFKRPHSFSIAIDITVLSLPRTRVGKSLRV